MVPHDSIYIKEAIAAYYPHKFHRGIILNEVVCVTINSTVQWRILWRDGSTGIYPVLIIKIGWIKI